MDPIDRIAPIVDNESAFRQACKRRLPSVVRVNTVKSTIRQAKAALDAESIDYETVDWNPRLLILDKRGPGNLWPYFHGWLHGQEEVSTLSAIALNPQPGERILETCAAPGSKTTHCAALMNDRGLIVGNDNNLGRLSALRANAERLGLTNLAITNQDARNYSIKPFQGTFNASDGFETFDRVLVDAPCSCDGTIRKNPDVREQWTKKHMNSITQIQQSILQRAIQLTTPGGRVVYSTCSFSPEENEAVVDNVLTELPCQIMTWKPPNGFETTQGETQWNGEMFDDSLQNTHRVYPHYNDTGGFFVAVLEVTA
ncbi:MAG: tRNA and rRNA cytosine-C5-methylase [Haloquadratum sp. J07HQX50]|jgi:tRNA and rRNA cytosine-C5-methylases|nr:MAG: tRNA and rRNA cytosine-C5-methylase [Haloquadratum sp. J07HQX50]